MTATSQIKVVGADDTIKQLRKIDPALRKQFNADVAEIARPATNAASAAYKFLPLSGMARNWKQDSRKLFPFDVAKASKGIKVKIDTSRRATATIYIQQTNPAAAIFETAGRKSSNRLGDALGTIQQGRTRLLGPSVAGQLPQITREISQLVIKVENDINRMVR